jgi:hypothetical protein
MGTTRRPPPAGSDDDLSRRLKQLVPTIGDRPYTPVADELASPTHADTERHALARAVLLTVLLPDPRVRALFETWGRSAGLSTAVAALARAVAAVRAAEAARSPDDHALTPSERRVVRTLDTALTRFRTRWEAFRQHPVPAPDTFVHETLRLPWPWVAVELVDAFRLRLVARATGVRIVRGFHGGVQAPPLTLSTAPGEVVEAVRRRLQDAEHALALATARLPKGRRATHHVARNVHWFYRSRVQVPPASISQLARAYHQTPGHTCATGDDRKVVQQGCKDAARWLGLTRVRVPAPPLRK